MLRDDLISIYEATVRSLSGETLVRAALAGRETPGRLQVLALGKAAGSMLRGAEAAWGPLRGVAVGPAGAEVPVGIELIVGEHPVPGRGSLAGGEKLLEAARSLRAGDHALVLLSGGASALAEVPAPGLALEDLQATTKLLLGAGMPIAGMNAVRKHLSALKGGRLALACGDATLEVLAISDVAGDDPATIASGPFTADPTTFKDALQALDRHGILEKIPNAIRRHLEAARDETPKELPPVDLRILAGPLDLPKKAAAIASEWGFVTTALPTLVEGDVEEVAARWRAWFAQRSASAERGCLLAAAAEPTVMLPPEPGSGGRSQHLALRMALAIAGTDSAFLAAGSDGKDGWSDHAGAAVDGLTASSAVEIEGALTHAASAAATARLRVALPAWNTGTNLADLHLLAIGR